MEAFGAPGVPPTWASSDKDLVGAALGTARVWFTLGHGILNEVFWPATGRPQIRDLGFIVAREGAWYEVKRVQSYTLTTPAPEVPLPQVVHRGEGYTLGLEYLADPSRDVVLVRYRLEGEGFRLYPLLAPHLGAAATTTPPGWRGRRFTPRKGWPRWPSWPSRSSPGPARVSWAFPMAGRTFTGTGA